MGNTIRWRFKLNELAPDLPPGSTFDTIRAHADINEPVFGIIGTGTAGSDSTDTSIDSGKTDTVYKLK